MDNLPLFKRYTPPSCTLSIYNPSSFFPFKKDNLSPDYSFELNFDDPRVPNQYKTTIKGDRTSLEKLRITINQYINHYLHSLDIDHNSEEGEDEKRKFKLYFKQKLQHQLITPENESITLNNTQLLDLINALESFYLDFLQSQNNTDLIFAPLQWGLGISAIALVMIGAIWWQNRQIIVEDNDQEIETSDLPSLPEVEPPTPLDRDLLPPIALPDVPDSLLQSQPLPPLDTPIPQPPTDTMGEIPSSGNDTPAIFIPGSPNLLDQTTRSTSPDNDNKNQFVIPAPPPEIAPAPQPLPRLGSTKPTLPDVPQLQARNPENEIPNAEENNTSASQQETPQEKIKQYFSAQWQPPESLTQSIEYRLIVDQKGSITRVTPIGQISTIYLDRTPIPLQGEQIISPFQDAPTVTIRLILSPNGDVVTFKE